MTNYEKVINMNQAELRKFLVKIMEENSEVFEGFCQEGVCPKWSLGECKECDTISNDYIIRWWLQQEAK